MVNRDDDGGDGDEREKEKEIEIERDENGARRRGKERGERSRNMERGPPYASLALSVTSQAWSALCLEEPSSGSMTAEDLSPRDVLEISERIVALLLVRIVALVSHREAGVARADWERHNDHSSPPPKPYGPYPDSSATAISETALEAGWKSWPHKGITPDLIKQLREYVTEVCVTYWRVPYHNVRHCFHVVASANKLMDMVLWEKGEIGEGGHLLPTYGLRSDPLTQLAFVFSALVHDVDHQGIANRQLVDESDELAILYNDQSVAEQRSLAVAFASLRRPEFEVLRSVMFPPGEGRQSSGGDYAAFRKCVINLVLCTDIANPERVQIVKSKWKEAFGETNETKQRKRRRERYKRRQEAAALAKAGQSAKSRFLHRSSFINSSSIKSSTAPVDIAARGEGGGDSGENRGNNRGVISDLRSMPEFDNLAHPRSEPQTLLKQFLRGRSSMATGTLIVQDEPAEMMNFHASAPLLITGNLTKNKEDEDEDDEGLLSLNSDSSLSPSVSSEGGVYRDDGYYGGSGDEDSYANDPNDGIIISGVTLSKSLHISSNNASAVAPDKGQAISDEALEKGGSVKRVWDKSGGRGTNESHVSKGGNSGGHKAKQGQRRRGSGGSSRGRRSGNMASRRQSSETILSQRSLVLGNRAFRRFSAPTVTKTKTYEFRLGIRRALDFTGSAIEAYSSSGAHDQHRHQGEESDKNFASAPSSMIISYDPDEPDELRRTVILEQMMRAADVAHLLQSWDNMVLWSSRLFYEQKSSFMCGRGFDPQGGWVEGQITFLDSYALPLVRRLVDAGVFHDEDAFMMVKCIQENRSRWLFEGSHVTEGLVQDWERINENNI